MNEKLNTHGEVEEMLGQLGRETYPGERMDGLTGLVWARLEHPTFSVSMAFRPAFTIVFMMTFLGVILWSMGRMGELPFGERRRGETLNTDIDVRGIVVEQRGVTSEARKLEVRSGDLVTTDEDSTMTIYLPVAGYLYLPEETNLLLSEAKQNSETARMDYRIILNSGSLYARLPEFEPGSFLTVQTQTGLIRVTGTDFLLGLNKDSSTSVFVLNGSVEAESFRKPDETKPVTGGSRALILPDSDGTLLVSALNPEEQIKLKADFEQIFGEIVAHESGIRKTVKERNIKILWRKDD